MKYLRHITTLSILVISVTFFLPTTLSPRLLAQQIDDNPTILEKIETSNGPRRLFTTPRVQVTTAQTDASCTAAPPVLLTPADDTIMNDLENPAYYWSSVPNITAYIFQLASEQTFADPLATEGQTAFADDTQVRHASGEDLRTDVTYFWRVASVCADGQIGVFAAPSSFQAGPGPGDTPCTLAPPILLAPVNGNQVDTLIPTTEWATANDVYEYRYQYAITEAFTRTVKSGVLFNIRPDKRATVGTASLDNLEPDTRYYWRVASVCSELDTQGAFSAPFSFRTAAVQTQLPTPPAQESPDDGITTGSIRVIVRFSEVVGATGYRVEFYDSLQSAERENRDSSTLTNSSPIIVILNPKETVFWRVRSRNDYGWGPLSAIRQFTTPASTATSSITPDSGGTLQPDPGFLKVTFPSGAVTSTTTVDFQLLASPQQPLPNFAFANRAFTLVASAGGAPITHFSQPYTMVITYDEGDLLSAGIFDPTQLNLLYWDGAAWTPVLPCAGCAINTTEHTMTVILDHFTEFALVGPLPRQLFYLPLVQR